MGLRTLETIVKKNIENSNYVVLF